MILGLLLIAAAFALTVYNLWDSSRAGKASQTALDALLEAMPQERFLPDERISHLPPEEYPDMAVASYLGYDYIGTLEIPEISLSLPIMASWSYEKLTYAPCVYSGSYYSGDLVICGHNYPSHFSDLKSIRLGAEVFLTTVEGVVYRYVIENRETVQPKAIEQMTAPEGQWDLTLFTCNLGGETRCAVRCVRSQE